MRFRVDVDELLAGLKLSMAAVGKSTTVPVLGYVLIEARKKKVVLSCTNLDQRMDVNVDCDVEKVGAICVQARMLKAILEKESGVVRVSKGRGERCALTTETGKYDVIGLGSEEFPDPVRESRSVVKVRCSMLKNLFGRVQHAMSDDDTRYVLNGVYLKVTDRVTTIAADGRRLAYATSDCSADNVLLSAIVPAVAVKILTKSLPDVESDVSLEFGADSIVVNARVFRVWSKVVDGDYPAVMTLIPDYSGGEGESILYVKREELIKAILKARIMTGEKCEGVRVVHTQKGIGVCSQNPDRGNAAVMLQTGKVADPSALAVNPEYMLDLLSVLFEDEIQVEWRANEPVLIKEADFLGLFMPLRDVGAKDAEKAAVCFEGFEEEKEEETDGTEAEEEGLVERAKAVLKDTGRATVTGLRRRLQLSSEEAVALMETLESEGIVGPAEGNKAREILIEL